jgi:hypothetical protein
VPASVLIQAFSSVNYSDLPWIIIDDYSSFVAHWQHKLNTKFLILFQHLDCPA